MSVCANNERQVNLQTITHQRLVKIEMVKPNEYEQRSPRHHVGGNRAFQCN